MKADANQEARSGSFTKSFEGYNEAMVVGFNRDGQDGRTDNGRDYVILAVKDEKFNKSHPLSSKEDECSPYFQEINEQLIKACGKQVPYTVRKDEEGKQFPLTQQETVALWNVVQTCVGTKLAVMMLPQEEPNAKGYINNFPSAWAEGKSLFMPLNAVGQKWDGVRRGSKSDVDQAGTGAPAVQGTESGTADDLPF